MLHDAGQEVLGGLLRAKQDQVDILVPAKQQAFSEDSDPHHTLQDSVTFKMKTALKYQKLKSCPFAIKEKPYLSLGGSSTSSSLDLSWSEIMSETSLRARSVMDTIFWIDWSSSSEG